MNKKPNSKLARHWILEIEEAEKAHNTFKTRAKKVTRAYTLADTSEKDTASNRGFHIFWSNVQTLKPALYSRRPNPEVTRRFKDKDLVGRVASQILERATDYAVDSYDFDSLMKQVRDDYLIVGRGQAWVRYEPYFSEERIQLSEEVNETGVIEYFDAEGSAVESEKVNKDGIGVYYKEELLAYEEAVCDYVHWDDFIHSPARTWDEVRWVARKVQLTKAELAERFGEKKAAEVKRTGIDSSLEEREDISDSAKDELKKATVYEVWDKSTKRVYWICKGYTKDILDSEDDPLQLTGFFPCPKPLLATTTNDSILPICDYLYYQDQSSELDDITQRITLLTQSLKLAGVYNAEFPDIGRLVDEAIENELIPVNNWAAFGGEKGLENNIAFLPIAEVANTIQNLYQIRDRLKAEIYELTGISDIVRGHSNAAETATAQQIKGQFATMRLADKQAEIQRFARDLIAMKAEIIAEHFEVDTIKLMSGSDILTETDEGVQVAVDDAIELLRNDALRTFRVDIETDSTVAIDKQLEREQKQEFMNTFTQSLQASLQIGQTMPELMPVMSEALAFMVRGVKAGRGMESAIEKAFNDIIQAQQQAQQQPPQPTPEQIELQQKQMNAEAELQIKQQKAQFDSQLAQQQAAFEQQLEKYKVDQELALKKYKADIENQLTAEKIRAKMVTDTIEATNDPAVLL